MKLVEAMKVYESEWGMLLMLFLIDILLYLNC